MYGVDPKIKIDPLSFDEEPITIDIDLGTGESVTVKSSYRYKDIFGSIVNALTYLGGSWSYEPIKQTRTSDTKG